MKIRVDGSALVIIMILMAILSGLMAVAAKTNFFMRALAHDSIMAQNHRSLTHGLLNYGIQIAKNNYEDVLKDLDPVELHVDTGKHMGIVKISTNGTHCKISAELFEDNRQLCHMSCTLARETENKFLIQCFQR